jgi:hypothetical protein
MRRMRVAPNRHWAPGVVLGALNNGYVPRARAFYEIVVTTYWRDHPPPHFHAAYGGQLTEIPIDSLELMDGWLSPRKLMLVVEWAGLHQDELRDNWTRARAHDRLVAVDPPAQHSVPWLPSRTSNPSRATRCFSASMTAASPSWISVACCGHDGRTAPRRGVLPQRSRRSGDPDDRVAQRVRSRPRRTPWRPRARAASRSDADGRAFVGVRPVAWRTRGR